MPSFIEDNAQWWIAGAIVLLGLVVYGFADLSRFSLKRAWAISQVAFSESIRRRVLWITPLAILGVIIVAQLQRAIDEQDAVRQTIKFTLFASGMVVTITAIILACTNLPKEIDTRVIYTIVTKPATRLEIVVGKIIGFAKVSATILIIMGLFAYGYLHLRAWNLRRDIADRLSSGQIEPISRATYEFWSAHGLLSSRSLAMAQDLQIFAHPPAASDNVRWFYGTGEGEVVVPFHLTEEDLTPNGFPNAIPGAAGLLVRMNVGFARSEYKDTSIPLPEPALPIGVAAPTSAPATTDANALPEARLEVQFLDQNFNALINAQQINKGEPVVLKDPTGNTPVGIFIPPEAVQNLLRTPVCFLEVRGTTNGAEYSVDMQRDPKPQNNPFCLFVPGATREQQKIIGPMTDPATGGTLPSLPNFRARQGMRGQQLRGGKPERSPVAIFRFRGAQPPISDGPVGFEMRLNIENSGADVEDEMETTRLEITVINPSAKSATAEPVYVYPENNRTSYFNIPASALAGGDFDVVIRNHSEGHYVGLLRTDVNMVAAEQAFDFNLIKSLSILWLLSLLVVIISIFCSTFLSWPIAIVLTSILLLGNWLVGQLSDTLQPGIGGQVATDIFGSGDPSKAKVVSASVEAMARLLNNLARILPDISQFSAIEQIEQGVTITLPQLLAPIKVLLAFGLPMVVLSYVFLRNKEVAP